MVWPLREIVWWFLTKLNVLLTYNPAIMLFPIKGVGDLCLHTNLHMDIYNRASLVTQMAKNPPAMWETWVQSLGWEDALEEGMANHSSILSWRNPMNREAWRATVHAVTKSWTQLSDSAHSTHRKSRWMGKQTFLHSDDGIAFRAKSKWAIRVTFGYWELLLQCENVVRGIQISP